MQVYLIIGLIFSIIVATFAIQNTTPVEITFLAWKFKEISLVLVILGSTAIGALCIFLFGMLKQVSQTLRIKELESDNNKLRLENEDLKDHLQSLKSQQANNFMPDSNREIEAESGLEDNTKEPENQCKD